MPFPRIFLFNLSLHFIFLFRRFHGDFLSKKHRARPPFFTRARFFYHLLFGFSMYVCMYVVVCILREFYSLYLSSLFISLYLSLSLFISLSFSLSLIMNKFLLNIINNNYIANIMLPVTNNLNVVGTNCNILHSCAKLIFCDILTSRSIQSSAAETLWIRRRD